MKHDITPFNYNGHTLSTITDHQGEIWFVAKEVAEILDYKDATELTKRLDEYDKQNLPVAGFGNRGVICINESGLYQATLESTKPEAKPFKKWVTSEVLPTLRKTGKYVTQEQAAPTTPPVKLKFDMSLQLAQVAMAELNLAPSGRLGLLQNIEKSYNLPAVLPRYAADNNGTQSANSSMSASSLTELLKKNGSPVSAVKANAILTVLGFLEDKSRPSTKTPDKIKHFKSVTKAGEAYGKNMLHPSNPRETQPLWYDDTFGELLDLILEHAKTAA
jgi:prophage antirepressor-like protein